MTERNFRELVNRRWNGEDCDPTLLCIGLDTDLSLISNEAQSSIQKSHHLPATGSPGPLILGFNKEIVEATKDLVCAYKPNLAFYLAYGLQGLWALQYTIEYIHVVATGVPVILDGKFEDIGNSAKQYARFAFKELRVDAVTVCPLPGKQDGVDVFLEYENKGVFVLCHTSNSGARDFQEPLLMRSEPAFGPYKVHPTWYQRVARIVSSSWNGKGNCGLVVGATYPGKLESVRKVVGDEVIILVPGIGEQGGNLGQAVCSGVNSQGDGLIINSSRGILYKSSGEDFAQVAREEAMRLRDDINSYVAYALEKVDK
jgi:orotidine-5'-phosphate decarboxylase